MRIVPAAIFLSDLFSDIVAAWRNEKGSRFSLESED